MILALDCAAKTGWCLWRHGRPEFSGVQDFAKRRGESNGLMFLRFDKWLRDTAAQAPANITLLVYERAHHRGGAATEVCTNLTGRVQQLAAELGIECAAVPTGTLKKSATGRGNAEKPEMIAAAGKYLGRQPQDDNEADAVLLAAYGDATYGDPQPKETTHA